jgi:hypothetical protein
MWNFGVNTDTEPTSLAFPKLDTPTSAVKDYSFGGGFAGFTAGQPLLLYSPNATNQTKMNFASYANTGG